MLSSDVDFRPTTLVSLTNAGRDWKLIFISATNETFQNEATDTLNQEDKHEQKTRSTTENIALLRKQVQNQYK